MADRATIKVSEHRQYQITAPELGVMVGRAFGVDTRGAWLELVTSDDDGSCDECGHSLGLDSWAVRLVLPFRGRDVEVGE